MCNNWKHGDRKADMTLAQLEPALHHPFWGAIENLGTVFAFADITMTMLAFVNLIALFLLFTHRANIARLHRGVEPRFERARDFERVRAELAGTGQRGAAVPHLQLPGLDAGGVVAERVVDARPAVAAGPGRAARAP